MLNLTPEPSINESKVIITNYKNASSAFFASDAAVCCLLDHYLLSFETTSQANRNQNSVGSQGIVFVSAILCQLMVAASQSQLCFGVNRSSSD